MSWPVLTSILQALRHSRVKLTWDEDDPERNQITRRTLTKQEIEKADFKAYLASSTSGSESETGGPEPQKSNAKWKEKEGASRDKLRALLLGGNDDELPEGWGRGDEAELRDVDMEITFRPGLTEVQDRGEGETTLEKYERKMKEKRKKRKEELKEKIVEKEQSGNGIDDDFFDAGSEQEEQSDTLEPSRREKGKRKPTDQNRSPVPPSVTRHELTLEELALLAASDNPNAEPKHFNLKAVLKAENKSKRKGKKDRKKGELDDNEIQEDFKIDLKDDRFKALHEDHTFAIDPSNPQCDYSILTL